MGRSKSRRKLIVLSGSQQMPKTTTMEINIRLVRWFRARSCSSLAADLKIHQKYNCRLFSWKYVGVRIYQDIRMIKRSEIRPLGGATFWDNHLLDVITILTPILVCLKPKILPIRWCHFLWQSPACMRGCVILYVGKCRLSCKRCSPFSCHPIGSHFLRQSPCRPSPQFSPLF